ncbi:(S)-mandelate dehydrogenase [Pseudooceanicola marinus]|uniref:(S)-mandelate dehydrogenase n=1 Tax=Pseudooceanicola marinus TaxID=396013 RepID=A0A1X6YT60_9RHOB|nr:alpha-hydroxy acid oxidase [Pseudooceanicola marinus]PJE29598.1 alpha-hydroxy-acid oxidizing enzyme [Pseudooceanicola marinus]SLN28651.1 (S)-mandelate dehydrogenase [Pseudooceanicola marinus]
MLDDDKDVRRDDRYATTQKYASLRGIRATARKNLSDMVWNYMHCGTGDEVTARANVAAFDDYLFEAPLFAGVANPDTSTRVLGHDLSFPAFTAPFGGGETLFHPDGMCAVGRAAHAAGIKQFVPVAAGHSLEEVRAASPAALVFQLTFVGEEAQVIDMMHRAKDAGYEYICVTYSPIRQWRERMMEDRFSMPGAGKPANFGPDTSDPAMLQELLDFTRPRWSWDQAARVIAASPLPCIIKGVTCRADATAALKAGAQGLYVSNYGGRTIDREPASISTLADVRDEAGPDVTVVFDSGIRRGSDIATALALGADAVLLGRTCALGLAADGEAGVQRVLDLLRDEFWTTLGHLGCSSVSDLSPAVFRSRL